MNRIIGFFGMDSQVGTTIVSQSIAEILAEKNKEVLYICASGKYGDYFFKNKDEKTIDSIKAGLINKSLDEEEIKNIIVKKNSLSIIPGVKNLTTVSYYPVDTLEYIINIIKEKYDYIIIDCGENLNLGINVAALKVCNKIYYLITQQPKSIKNALNVKLDILNKLELKGDVIVNKYINNLSLLSVNEIEKIIAQPVVVKFPYLEHGWEAEIEEKTLLKYPKFKHPAEELSSLIAGEEVDICGKRVLFGRLFKKRDKMW